MTERFRLAANVLLKRRLNNLVRIDNNLEIDLNYITCAEYQLFIDDMRQAGKNRQPDHWISERFLPGNARKPITGVRSSDAQEFCHWLTQQELIPGYRYRLPNLAETNAIYETKEPLGCWCKYKNNLVIAEIQSQQWLAWQQKLFEFLIFRGDFVLNHEYKSFLNHNLYDELYRELYDFINRDVQNFRYININIYGYRDLYTDLNQDLYSDIYFFLNSFLNQDVYCNFNRDLYKNLNRDVYDNFNRDLYKDLNRDLYKNLNFVLDHFSYEIISRPFYRNLFPNFYSKLYQDLNRNFYEKIDIEQASNLLLLSFPIMFLVIIYHLLDKMYEQAFENFKMRFSIGLTLSECQQKSQKYAQKRDEIFQLYAYLVLIDQRQKGNMPAWEGIRIVREREEID